MPSGLRGSNDPEARRLLGRVNNSLKMTPGQLLNLNPCLERCASSSAMLRMFVAAWPFLRLGGTERRAIGGPRGRSRLTR